MEKMSAKKIVSLLLVMLILVVGSSCGYSDNKTSQPLRVLISNYDTYISNAVESFNKTQGKNLVEAETFFMDQSQDYADRLKAELASGKGPDIVAIPSFMIPDFSKLITNGYLYDLNALMDKDSEFKAGDYFEPVLNTGVVNGGRYFLPYAFSVNAYYTTGKILGQYGIDPDTPFLSLDTLSRLADDYGDKLQENGAYLIDEVDVISPCVGVPGDILYCKDALESERISRLLESHKAIREVMSPPVQIGPEFYKRLEDGKVCFLRYPIFGFSSLNAPYSSFQSVVVPEICSVAFNTENEVMAQPTYLIAINASCRDREAAYNFIKHVLSEEVQSNGAISGFPVNRAAYAALKEEYIAEQSSGGCEKQYVEKLVKELDDLLSGSITCTMLDPDVVDVLHDELSTLLEKGASSDEIVTALDQKLSEYRERAIRISEESLAQVQESTEDVPVLTVWYMDYDWSVKNAVRSFTEKRKDVKIESEVCSADSYDESVMKMAAEIMAGEGPDIIFFTPTMFNSLYKTMKSGAFCDLNPLIANDETFGSLDLNQEILDTGVYQGKRYFIPLRYGIPLLMTTDGILEENGITIGDDWSLEDLGNTLRDYASHSGKQYFFGDSISFSKLLDFCGKSFIDYETSQCDFQTDAFIALMKFYKDMLSHTMPSEQVPQNELSHMSMKNKRFAVNLDYVLSPEQLEIQNSVYNAILAEDMVIYPFPTMDGGTAKPAVIMYAVAVNQNCKNKQAALDFIEELLSANIQASYDQYGNSNLTLGLPVNREALRSDMDYLVTRDVSAGGIISAGNLTLSALPLPETLANRMVQLADQAIAIPVQDKAVAEIIDEGVASYLEGKRAAEQAAKDIDEKVRLFLNE